MIYVISDTHACTKVLVKAYTLFKANYVEGDKLVIAWDIVDRGLDNIGSLVYALELTQKDPNVVFLKGNHEELLIEFFRSGYFHEDNGSKPLIKDLFAYAGLDNNFIEDLTQGYNGLQDPLLKNTDIQRLIGFLQKLEVIFVQDKLIITHAGYDFKHWSGEPLVTDPDFNMNAGLEYLVGAKNTTDYFSVSGHIPTTIVRRVLSEHLVDYQVLDGIVITSDNKLFIDLDIHTSGRQSFLRIDSKNMYNKDVLFLNNQ